MGTFEVKQQPGSAGDSEGDALDDEARGGQ
jgi:hypothetical protein